MTRKAQDLPVRVTSDSDGKMFWWLLDEEQVVEKDGSSEDLFCSSVYARQILNLDTPRKARKGEDPGAVRRRSAQAILTASIKRYFESHRVL